MHAEYIMLAKVRMRRFYIQCMVVKYMGAALMNEQRQDAMTGEDDVV